MPSREAAHLLQRYRVILSGVGVILGVCGGLLLVPLLALLAWPEEARHAPGFLLPAVLLMGVGWSLWRGLRPREPGVLTLQEGGVIVVLGWVAASLFGAWPFMAVEGMSFRLGLLEAVSGWTTTGLSVVNVEQAAHATLLWRSVMQLVGGAGLAIVMLAAIVAPVGTALWTAEGRGQQLVPQIRQSARLVVLIYGGYVAVGVPAYWLAGMGFFDAVNHAFAALSTGGFSTRTESIGYFDSPAVEAVSVVLMLAGSLNFATAYLLLQGRWRAVGHNGEVRLTAALVPSVALAVLLLNCQYLYPSLGKSARVAVFETVSALTTTGFQTVGYGDWNTPGVLLLILLMVIGGGACSTAGGLKQNRVYLLWRAVVGEVQRRRLPPRTVVPLAIWEGERPVLADDARVREAAVYLALYLATLAAGTLVIAASGHGLEPALFECASALGTVGLTIGVTSAQAPAGVLWTEIGCMLLGRLEFFVVLVSLAKMARDLSAVVWNRGAARARPSVGAAGGPRTADGHGPRARRPG